MLGHLADSLARRTHVTVVALVACVALTALPVAGRAQIRRGATAVAPGQQPVQLRSDGRAREANGRARSRPAVALTIAQKEAIVRGQAHLMRPQPEAPIRLDATTLNVHSRGELYVKNADLYGGYSWGVRLPREDSELQLNLRLDAGKAHLLDCLVLFDTPAGTIVFQGGGQKTAMTINGQTQHVTWVFIPQTSDWYTIIMSATPAGGVGGPPLEVSYCEVTPFK
jgi:hypothetical protein